MTTGDSHQFTSWCELVNWCELVSSQVRHGPVQLFLLPVAAPYFHPKVVRVVDLGRNWKLVLLIVQTVINSNGTKFSNFMKNLEGFGITYCQKETLASGSDEGE